VSWQSHGEGCYLEYIFCNDIPAVMFSIILKAKVRAITKGRTGIIHMVRCEQQPALSRYRLWRDPIVPRGPRCRPS